MRVSETERTEPRSLRLSKTTEPRTGTVKYNRQSLTIKKAYGPDTVKDNLRQLRALKLSKTDSRQRIGP